MEDLPKDPKTAGLPPYLDGQHESVRNVPMCTELNRIFFGLRWWRRRRFTASSSAPAAASATQHRPGGLYQWQCWRISMLRHLSQKASASGSDGWHRGQPDLGLV
jgi:hypothetical protein